MQNERKFKFGLVAHSSELAETIRKYMDPTLEDLKIRIVDLDEAVPAAKSMLTKGAEVILAHGGIGDLIFQVIGQPIVVIPRTNLDLITSFRKAKKSGHHIGLTTFSKLVPGIDIIDELLDIKVEQIVFSSTQELKDEIYSAFKAGTNVIVGGGVSKKFLNALGGKGIICLPNENVVREALKQARSLVSARRQEAARAERIRTILQMTDEGVISVDKYGRIDIYNKTAENLLGLSLEKFKGQSLSRILKDANLIEALTDNVPVIDTVKKLGNKNILINTLPVKINKRIEGAVAFIKEAEKIERINRKIREGLYTRGFLAKHKISDIKTQNPKMKQLLGKAKKYAMTDAAILIQGETGTGKGLLSESIHNLSSRKHEPFVAVNCAALPDSLLESELFGYEEGAFTGAKKGGKIGLFELANKGTLFLDEMAAISNSIQSRLVKVIEEKEIMRVGGDRYVPVDIRIISACNKDLRREAISGKFRADLYFRIAVLNLNTQPLRDRFEDVFYIMEDLLTKYGKKPKALSAKMIKTMESYSWPGNIRELRSFIESYLILLGESTCNSHLFLSLFDEKLGCGEDQTTALSGVVENACELENNLFTSIGEAIKDGSLKEVLGKYEIFVINETLRGCRFNKKETAKRLGISVNTLWRKLNKSEESAGF